MKKILAGITSFLVLLSPGFALAQNADLNSKAWVNPSFNVGVKLIAQDSTTGAVQGSVDVQNDNDAAFGGIRLQALLLDPAPEVTTPNTIVPDTARVLDRVVFPGEYEFSPNQKMTIPFTYTPPKLSEGQYRIRLQIITNNGNEYGWDDAAITLGSKDAQFAFLAPGPITVKGVTSGPLDGVNVDPSSTVTASYGAKVSTSKAMTAIPVLTTYAFDLTGKVVSTEKLPPVTIASNKTFAGTFPITVSAESGAYQATLVLQDAAGNIISSMNQYRWVVTGVTARVVTGSFLSLTGTGANIQFQLAGPADGVTSVNTGVKVSLLDGDTVLQEETTTIPDLGKNGLQAGNATFSFNTPLKNPGLRIELINSDTNGQLDQYEVHVPYVAEQAVVTPYATPSVQPVAKHIGATIYIVGGAVICALLGLLGWMRYKKLQAKKTIIPLLLLIIGTGASLLVAGSFTKDTRAANGIVIAGVTQPGDKYTIYATINKPLHNNNVVTEPADPGKIPVSFVLYYGTCNNKVTSPEVYVYNLRSGGKAALGGSIAIRAETVGNQSGTRSYLVLNSPSGLNWDTYQNYAANKTNGAFDRLVYNAYPFTRCSGSQNCTLAVSFTGNVSVSNAYDSATLLWIFRVGYDSVGEREHFQLIQAMYTWVNFKIPATPTPNPTPTPTPTSTTNPTPTPTPTSTTTPTPTVSPTPTTTPVSGNNPPVSVASISAGNGAFGSSITVEQGTPVSIKLSANGSSDPDGWTTPSKGISQGGKCEWNSDLNQGAPTFETTIADPSGPAACQISLGTLTFNDAPGTYTYKLLRITDAAGAQSNNGTVSVTVVAKGSPTPTPNPTTSASPSATPTFGSGNFQETR
ncbi:MAG: hypothetical protein K8Q97_02080 [Candidatus Andersenbacteria bacterium]|nr:hypothetical protein [Candidatus Andersenbacteria bacterium]